MGRIRKYSELYESGISRFIKHITNHDTGLMSAFRGYRNCGEGKAYTLAENKARNLKLKAMLENNGYGTTTVDGVFIENFKLGKDKWTEVQEETFFIVDLKDKGKLKNVLKAYGEMFEQDSVLFIPQSTTNRNGDKKSYMIGTNHCKGSFIEYGEEQEYDTIKLGKEDTFCTKINNRPFYLKQSLVENLNESDVFIYNGGWSGGMARKRVAEGNWEDLVERYVIEGLRNKKINN